jgi:hypothetical protein
VIAAALAGQHLKAASCKGCGGTCAAEMDEGSQILLATHHNYSAKSSGNVMPSPSRCSSASPRTVLCFHRAKAACDMGRRRGGSRKLRRILADNSLPLSQPLGNLRVRPR